MYVCMYVYIYISKYTQNPREYGWHRGIIYFCNVATWNQTSMKLICLECFFLVIASEWILYTLMSASWEKTTDCQWLRASVNFSALGFQELVESKIERKHLHVGTTPPFKETIEGLNPSNIYRIIGQWNPNFAGQITFFLRLLGLLDKPHAVRRTGS